MKIKKNCLIETYKNVIVCEENKRKILFFNKNNKKVIKIIIDNCQIENGLRCDFLVIFNNLQNFIELKGNDISHAFKQLERTINLLGKNQYLKKAFVISSRSPLSSPELQNKKLFFKRKLKTMLIVKNKFIKINIE